MSCCRTAALKSATSAETTKLPNAFSQVAHNVPMTSRPGRVRLPAKGRPPARSPCRGSDGGQQPAPRAMRLAQPVPWIYPWPGQQYPAGPHDHRSQFDHGWRRLVRHSGDLPRLLRGLPGIEFHDGSEHPKFRTQGGGSWWTRFGGSEGAAAAHDVVLVGGGAADCGQQSPLPRPIRVSAWPWFRRSIRCAATLSQPRRGRWRVRRGRHSG